MFDTLKLKLLKKITKGDIKNLDSQELVDKIKDVIDDSIITFDEAIEILELMTDVINACIINRVKVSISNASMSELSRFISTTLKLVAPISEVISGIRGRI